MVVQVTPEITLSAEQMHDEGDVNGTVSTHNSFKVESALSSTPSLGERAIDCRNRTEMLELLAEVGGGEAPAQDINNWHSFLVMVRIIWNISSERVEGWILQLPTGEVALHFIPVPSFGELKLAHLNGSTIGFEDLSIVTIGAGFLDCRLQKIVDKGLLHWLT